MEEASPWFRHLADVESFFFTLSLSPLRCCREILMTSNRQDGIMSRGKLCLTDKLHLRHRHQSVLPLHGAKAETEADTLHWHWFVARSVR